MSTHFILIASKTCSRRTSACCQEGRPTSRCSLGLIKPRSPSRSPPATCSGWAPTWRYVVLENSGKNALDFQVTVPPGASVRHKAPRPRFGSSPGMPDSTRSSTSAGKESGSGGRPRSTFRNRRVFRNRPTLSCNRPTVEVAGGGIWTGHRFPEAAEDFHAGDLEDASRARSALTSKNCRRGSWPLS